MTSPAPAGRTLNIAEVEVYGVSASPSPPPQPPPPPDPPATPPSPPSPPSPPPGWPSPPAPPSAPPPPYPPLVEFRGDLFTGWQSYRLGDFFHYLGSVMSPQDTSNTERLLRTQWPNSIAAEYHRATHGSNNYGVMTRIIRARGTAENTPPPNTVVVHLRVGDVLDMNGMTASANEWNVNGLLAGHAPGKLLHYTYPLGHYVGAIRRLPARPLPGGSRVCTFGRVRCSLQVRHGFN